MSKLSKVGLIICIMSSTIYMVGEVNKAAGTYSPATFWLTLVVSAFFFAIGALMFLEGE